MLSNYHPKLFSTPHHAPSQTVPWPTDETTHTTRRQLPPEALATYQAPRYLILEGLGRLPGEVRVVAAEVTVRGRLLEDGSAQVQVADQCAGAEVEVALDDLGQLGVRLATAGARAVRINEDGQRVRHTDRVGELDQHTVAEAGRDEGLGHPTGSVGSGTIHLGKKNRGGEGWEGRSEMRNGNAKTCEVMFVVPCAACVAWGYVRVVLQVFLCAYLGGVLAREGSTAVGPPPAVGVDDDLASG